MDVDAQGLGSGPLEALKPLTGGTQNILLTFSRAGRGYVLRRPPRHPRADGNRTIQREARILGALAGSRVPHPGLIAACEDSEVLGASFYLMEPIEGFNAMVGLPQLHAKEPTLRRRMGFAMIDALLELGNVDHQAVGLSDFGRADGFLDRQVSRWQSQFEGYGEYSGWNSEALGDFGDVVKWLDQRCPASFIPGIMHGDYHMGNVMFRHDGPELAAVVDWELATIGDPLVDLGWLLVGWPDEYGGKFGNASTVRPWDGFPSAEELIDRYREGSSRDLAHIDWYRTFTRYKLAILLEGTHARACAGKASSEMGQMLHVAARDLMDVTRRAVQSLG